MNAIVALPLEQKIEIKPLKPMGLIESILLFGIPAAALAASLWLLWPALVAAGMDRALAYTICLTGVNIGLLVASIVGYVLEGNPLTWSAYAQRMRLTRMTGNIWLWAIFGTIFYLLLSLVINFIAVPLLNALKISIALPWPSTSGWMHVVILFFNIVGEELWWRGYILPRQELSFGKRTFLLHGILWACFHMYKWVQVPFMFFTTWVIPFIAQRKKNTWPGMIMHLSLNSSGPLLEIIFKALNLI
jgi:hypothetical protein